MKRLSQNSDESQHSTYVNLKIFDNFFWVNKKPKYQVKRKLIMNLFQ
jgi:hypothetical protein